MRGGSPEPGHLGGGGSVSPPHSRPRQPRRAPQGPWRGGWARRVMKPARLFRHPALPALPACRKIGQSAPGQTMPGSRAKPSFKGRERRPRGALRGDCFQPAEKNKNTPGWAPASRGAAASPRPARRGRARPPTSRRGHSPAPRCAYGPAAPPNTEPLARPRDADAGAGVSRPRPPGPERFSKCLFASVRRFCCWLSVEAFHLLLIWRFSCF